MGTVPDVAAFTDTYLPTVNGVTYTVETWRDRWVDRGGRMAVVYPSSDHDPGVDEHPVRSLPFPFYEGFRFAVPLAPDDLDMDDLDVVHTHTPFTMGLTARRVANGNQPIVASYHTPAAEYAEYLLPGQRPTAAVRRLANGYERWFYDSVDTVIAPSRAAKRDLRDRGIESTIDVVPNGVDTERFAETDPSAFRSRHGLVDADPLVGYTGRHGYEKCLEDLIAAADGLDATVVIAGDGPARDALEEQAAGIDADVRFLGFLDRSELPEFYSAIDVFAFPSPVETQGLVALEAMACGTPVVGADSRALAETIDQGSTGYCFETGNPDALRAAVERALDEVDTLRQHCFDRREQLSVEAALDELCTVYENVR